MNVKQYTSTIFTVACLSLVFGCSNEVPEISTAVSSEATLPLKPQMEEASDSVKEQPIEFQSANEAIQAFLDSHGSKKSQAKNYLVSDSVNAVPALIQTLANLGGAVHNPLESHDISSVLIEVGDEALPALLDAKARIDQFLKKELMQRAYDSAAHRVDYDAPPVVSTLMSVRASIESVIDEIQN